MRKPEAPERAKNAKGSSSRISNSLVALSSAAVLAVYSTGYLRTRAAAARLDATERPRVVIPAEAVVPTPIAALPLPTPATLATAAPAPSPSPSATALATPASPKAVAAIDASAPTPSPIPSPVTSASPTPTPSPAPAPSPSPATYKDGTFSGWGTSRHGDIEATVVIEAGKIANAYISQCLTRYSCSWVAHLQGQVVARQSPEVDYVTGATQSANAFYYAVVQALSKAK